MVYMTSWITGQNVEKLQILLFFAWYIARILKSPEYFLSLPVAMWAHAHLYQHKGLFKSNMDLQI